MHPYLNDLGVFFRVLFDMWLHLLVSITWFKETKVSKTATEQGVV